MIRAINIPKHVEMADAEFHHRIKGNLRNIRKVVEFPMFSTESDCVRSFSFSSGMFPTIRNWSLCVYTHVQPQNISVQLRLMIDSKVDMDVCFEYSWKCHLMDANGKLYITRENNKMLSSPHNLRNCISNFAKFKNLNLRDGTLYLVCEIFVITDVIDITKGNYNEDNSRVVVEDLSEYFDSGRFADVTFVVDGKELRAHKNILSLRCEVFAAMFDHEMMEENKTNRVVITDFDYGVIKELLRFIYSNDPSNIEKMAGNLLAAAEKYGLRDLKSLCEAALEGILTVDTAIETFVLAHHNYAHQLKSTTMKFIKENIDNIVQTNDWNFLMFNYPDLVTELCCI